MNKLSVSGIHTMDKARGNVRDDVDDTTSGNEMMKVSAIIQRTRYDPGTEPEYVS